MLPRDAEILVVTDLHGNSEFLGKLMADLRGKYLDEKELFKIKENKKRNFYMVFLGDYSDRGENGLDTLFLLMRLKIENPDNVFLLRGNHESYRQNMLTNYYGKNCLGYEYLNNLKRSESDFVRQIITVYDCMPSALYIGRQDRSGAINYVMLSHSGGVPYYADQHDAQKGKFSPEKFIYGNPIEFLRSGKKFKLEKVVKRPSIWYVADLVGQVIKSSPQQDVSTLLRDMETQEIERLLRDMPPERLAGLRKTREQLLKRKERTLKRKRATFMWGDYTKEQLKFLSDLKKAEALALYVEFVLLSYKQKVGEAETSPYVTRDFIFDALRTRVKQSDRGVMIGRPLLIDILDAINRDPTHQVKVLLRGHQHGDDLRFKVKEHGGIYGLWAKKQWDGKNPIILKEAGFKKPFLSREKKKDYSLWTFYSSTVVSFDSQWAKDFIPTYVILKIRREFDNWELEPKTLRVKKKKARKKELIKTRKK